MPVHKILICILLAVSNNIFIYECVETYIAKETILLFVPHSSVQMNFDKTERKIERENKESEQHTVGANVRL